MNSRIFDGRGASVLSYVKRGLTFAALRICGLSKIQACDTICFIPDQVNSFDLRGSFAGSVARLPNAM
jgi:hypothetical protein